jgi:hypothetical protein
MPHVGCESGLRLSRPVLAKIGKRNGVLQLRGESMVTCAEVIRGVHP